ncbi:MAG: RNA methyltransferase [Chloroflexota bacterium]|nr:RNA methyltransferase [Chloroflexota bacterium]
MLKPLKWYKQLATKKGRLQSGAFLIEGERAIGQIISSHPDEILEIITSEETSSVYSHYPVRIVTESQFQSICSTKTPQGVMAVVRMPSDVYADHLPEDIGRKVLLLENIQDPGNVGTLIRAAVAFDFSGVVLTDKCADPFSPKCVQSTAGTVLSLWLRRTADYLEFTRSLKANGYSLVVADVDGTAPAEVLKQQNRFVLALGNEAFGPSRGLLVETDFRISIPIARHKAESLNVAACGAICMYLSS